MSDTGSANSRQIGGDHYRSDYIHWDFVIRTKMGYLEGCATKYLSRWKKKGGVVDLKKALHFVDKLIENIHLCYPSEARRALPSGWVDEEARRFCEINHIPLPEAEAIRILARWETARGLNKVRWLINDIIESSKPPLRSEENNHAIQEDEETDEN